MEVLDAGVTARGLPPLSPLSAKRSISDVVGELLARAPEWIRHDLVSKEPLVRGRAEETLAAMIAAALTEKPNKSSLTA